MKNVFLLALLMAIGSTGFARKKKVDPLPQQPAYIPTDNAELHTTGSLWSDQGTLADMSRDYKAHRVNDLIMIRIVESTNATSSGQAKTSRAFAAQSAVSSLGGKLKAANNLQNLLNLNSSNSLNGQAAATSTTAMTTVLTGRVIQVLPNGNMMIEATRDIDINHERQTAIVHGLVRPGDVAFDNSVLSTSVGDLSLQLKGKGLVSDSTRPPNKVVSLILKIMGF